MKRWLCCLLTLVLALTFTAGALGAAADPSALSGKITFVCTTDNTMGMQAVLEEYKKTRPNVEVEIVSLDSVSDFEQNMTAWIQNETMPDMYMAQVANTEHLYAKNGYLLELPDDIMARLVDGDHSIIACDGKFYIFPMSLSFSVTFANVDKLAELGITFDTEHYPRSMDEFVALLEECRQKGVQYPYGIAGTDLSQVTAWAFQYIYQVVYGKDPNWYADILTGTKHWNDPEFVQLYEDYNRIKEYVAPDSVAKANADVYADFIKGDVVFYNHTSNNLTALKSIDPDINVIMLPPSFTEDPKDQTLIQGFDSGISITRDTKHPEICYDLLDYLTSDEGSTIFDNAVNFIPTTKECHATVPAAYELVLALAREGRYPVSPLMSRQWIAGFSQLLKEGTQNWFTGDSPKDVCDAIEEGHKRLTDAKPEWVEDFMASYIYK